MHNRSIRELSTIAVITFLFSSIPSWSQQNPEIYLSPWPAVQHRGAVSIAFDDGYRSHIDRAAVLLEQFGFRGTFYLIVDKQRQQGKYRKSLPRSWKQWREVASRGHEIGSHTTGHEDLQTLDEGQILAELLSSQQLLASEFPSLSISSLAYPFSSADERVFALARELYVSGRLGSPVQVQPYHNEVADIDLIQLKSYFLCSGQQVAEWNDAVDSALDSGGWFIETLHPLDEVGYCGIRSDDWARHLAYLYSLDDAIWVAPVGQVAERIRRWNELELGVVTTADGIYSLDCSGVKKGEAWQVRVKVDDPERWLVRGEEGGEYDSIADESSLNFVWPAGRNEMFLERRVEVGVVDGQLIATQVESAAWAQIKDKFGVEKR